MDSYSNLLEAFASLHERKRSEPESLTKGERDRWRRMRRDIEEALFSQAPEPGADKREFLRVPVALAVRYWSHRELRDRFIPVMGENGLFVATADPLPPGSRLELELALVHKGVSFKLQGEVVWARREGDPAQVGMGIRFVELTDAQRKAIFTLVDDSLRQNLVERRRFARLDSRLPVQMMYPEGSFELTTEDLSVGGLFVATDHLPHGGEWLRFNLELPGGDAPLRLLSEVVRAEEVSRQGRPAGVGVRFLDLDPRSLVAIQRALVERVVQDDPSSASGRRCFPRVKRRIKLRLQAGGRNQVGWCRDISLGGVFVQTRVTLSRGVPLEVGVASPQDGSVLMVPGRVVRAMPCDPAHPHRIPGMAVGFTPGERKRELLRQLLKDLVLQAR